MAENSETSAIIETPENPTIQEVPISESSQPAVAQPLEPPESSASERAQPLESPSSSAEAPKRRGRPAGTKDTIKRERKPKPKPVKVTPVAPPSSDSSPCPVATPPRPLNRFERRAALFDSWFQ